MWKWIAVAALIYGLVGLLVATAPPRPAQVDIPFEQLPHVLDFEHPYPGALTIPRAHTEVVEVSPGQHALQWSFKPGKLQVHSLALPCAPPSPDVRELVLMVKADSELELHIGVIEEDRSLYATLRTAGSEPREIFVPLAELQPSERFSDENGQLDRDQIRHIVLAWHNPRPKDAPPQIEVWVDDVRFEPMAPPPPPDLFMP